MRELRVAGGFLTAILLIGPSNSYAENDEPGGPEASKPAAAPTKAAPTAAPAAGGAATPASVAPANANAGASYTVRLHDLERRVNELKEQIFRSKARLSLLKETVLHGAIAGSRAIIMHRNEMGSTYRLIKLVYALDGAEIYSKSDDSGHITDSQEFEIFNGSIVPGNHTLSVVMVYQGNGFGVFSYLKGYKFTVRGSHTFAIDEGKQTQLKVVGFEKGNPITSDPTERPALDFRENILTEKAPSATAEAKK